MPDTLTTHSRSSARAEESDIADAQVVAGGRGRQVLGLLVSVVALAGCIWWALQQPAPTFPDSPARIALVLAAVLGYAAATILRGLRWDFILRRANVGHRASDAYGLLVVGYMGNTILPARGGEVLRIVLLSERSGARRREVLGSVIPERLLDIAALGFVFVVLSLAGVAGSPLGSTPALLVGAGLFLGLAAGLVYLRLRIAGRLARFAELVRPMARASRLLLTWTGAWLGLLSVGIWLVEGIVFWLVGQSLGISIALTDAVFVAVLAACAAVIPAGPGFVGTYDAAVLFGLAAVGVDGGDAVGWLVLSRLVNFGPITVAGLILLLTQYGGWHRRPSGTDRARGQTR